jgi:hypothetical protein
MAAIGEIRGNPGGRRVLLRSVLQRGYEQRGPLWTCLQLNGRFPGQPFSVPEQTLDEWPVIATLPPEDVEPSFPPLADGIGSLRAILDALDRRRCLFWTGNVLVELDRDFDPAEEGVGGVTMVLDEDDMAALRGLMRP